MVYRINNENKMTSVVVRVALIFTIVLHSSCMAIDELESTDSTSYNGLRSNTHRKMPAAARVIGGSNAKMDDYPWYAELHGQYSSIWKDLHCGGSLVTPEWVVTVLLRTVLRIDS